MVTNLTRGDQLSQNNNSIRMFSHLAYHQGQGQGQVQASELRNQASL
jgi:hypothetical protein